MFQKLNPKNPKNPKNFLSIKFPHSLNIGNNAKFSSFGGNYLGNKAFVINHSSIPKYQLENKLPNHKYYFSNSIIVKMKELKNISLAFPESIIDRTKFFQDYFKDDRRNMNDDLCPLARNAGNWEYQENGIALRDYYKHLLTITTRNSQVPMIAFVGGSGSGKSYTMDTQAKNLNERNFEIFGIDPKDTNQKTKTHFIAFNISLNGNTNSTFVPELKSLSLDEKKKLLNREAALRILFGYFQKRVEYNQVRNKWDAFYEKMEGKYLNIKDALKIVIEDALQQDPSIKDKDTIIVLGVDEISMLNDGPIQESDLMRSLICQASDSFYMDYTSDGGVKLDKLHVKTVFTSFLPKDVRPFSESRRPNYYAYLKPLSLETVTKKLMKEYYTTPAFRAAIHSCIGHQRSLEELYIILKKSEGITERHYWFQNAIIEDITAIDQKQIHIFNFITQELCEKLKDYSQKMTWESLEPCLTGREIILKTDEPFQIAISSNDQKSFSSLDTPTYYDHNQKQVVKSTFSYRDLFSNGVFINTIKEEKYGKKIVPKSTIFWLYLWRSKNPFTKTKDSTIQNGMEKRLVFVEKDEKDLRAKFLDSLLPTIGWNQLIYQTFSPRMFAFKLELARCRTNEISLYDFFNGSLRWNPESIDPKEIIFQFSDSPITLSSCSSYFSTLIKNDPSALEIGKVIDFSGSNPGFDHLAILKCKIRYPKKHRYSEKSILIPKQVRYLGMNSKNSPVGLSEVKESFSKTMKELNKPYKEKGNTIPLDTKKELKQMEKIFIFDSLRRTEFDKGEHKKLIDGKKKGKYLLKEIKTKDGLILEKYTKLQVGENEDGKKKEIRKRVEYKIQTIDSLDLLEDKFLPKGVYVITDNEKAYGPTLSINKMGKFLQVGKEEEEMQVDNQDN